MIPHSDSTTAISSSKLSTLLTLHLTTPINTTFLRMHKQYSYSTLQIIPLQSRFSQESENSPTTADSIYSLSSLRTIRNGIARKTHLKSINFHAPSVPRAYETKKRIPRDEMEETGLAENFRSGLGGRDRRDRPHLRCLETSRACANYPGSSNNARERSIKKE